MIEEIEVQGYRSVRAVRMRMGPVLVVVGENGTGKTNLAGQGLVDPDDEESG